MSEYLVLIHGFPNHLSLYPVALLFYTFDTLTIFSAVVFFYIFVLIAKAIFTIGAINCIHPDY